VFTHVSLTLVTSSNQRFWQVPVSKRLWYVQEAQLLTVLRKGGWGTYVRRATYVGRGCVRGVSTHNSAGGHRCASCLTFQ